jgi:hypothetical protein
MAFFLRESFKRLVVADGEAQVVQGAGAHALGGGKLGAGQLVAVAQLGARRLAIAQLAIHTSGDY